MFGRLTTGGGGSADVGVPECQVSILTGGADKPYALGLAHSLLAEGIRFDFVGSDYVDGPDLHGNALVRFLNLRGDQNPDATVLRKIWRVLLYYFRLACYAASAPTPVFHVLWNNKIEYVDRTLLMLYYRMCGKRVVLTAHNVNVRKRDGSDSWVNRLTLRIQYVLSAHIFVHTERMRQELLDDFKVEPARVSVIPFGINSTVPNTCLNSESARRKIGLLPNHKVILFFGNIAPYKGLEYLIKALARLKPHYPEMRLVIAGRPKGEAEYWARTEGLVSELDLRENVLTRIEYVPDEETEVYFKAADVFALPYVHIFQSGVLFLGFNFGLPVIATDVGSLREDIIDGMNGLVCRPQDPVDLARTLQLYFESDMYLRLESNRETIRRIAENQHSWAKVATITRAVYSQVAGRGLS